MQAVKGFTINSIKTRRKRHGMAATKRSSSRGSSSTEAPAFFDLNNMFEVQQLEGTCFRPPKYLSIASEAHDTAMGEGAAATVMRQRKILVSDTAASCRRYKIYKLAFFMQAPRCQR